MIRKQYPLFRSLRGRLYPDHPRLGDMPILLLCYLGFLAYPFTLGAPASLSMTIVSLVLFLPCYFLAWWDRPRVPAIAAIWIIWFAFVQFNFGMSCYVIYACSFASFLRTDRSANFVFFALLLSTSLTLYWVSAPLVAYFPILIVGTMTFLEGRSSVAEARWLSMLSLSQQEITKLAEKNERERIARDVHDLLGHSLTLIALKSDLARRQLRSAPEQAEAELQHVAETAREALAEVRATVHGMRTPQWQVELAKSKLACEAAGIQLNLTQEEVIQGLDKASEGLLAMSLREAINNVVRHSKANRVEIDLTRTSERMEMRICNDGLQIRDWRIGSGLSAMRERIEAENGQLDIQIRDREFVLRVQLPLALKQSESIQQSFVAEPLLARSQI